MVKVKLLRYTKDGIKLIADSCRVSGVPSTLSDEEIIRMVVKNDYTSAIEHISFTFDLSEISVALSRELLEHRMVSHTARSTRYNDEKDFGFFMPKEFDEKGKEDQKELYAGTIRKISEAYDSLRAQGISRESARHVLPMALHTNYVWTINARSLINFLGLRLCVRAAPEIRELAKQMHEIAADIYPGIFKGIYCRGHNIGLCPESIVRDSTDCPFKKKIPVKTQVMDELWGK